MHGGKIALLDEESGVSFRLALVAKALEGTASAVRVANCLSESWTPRPGNRGVLLRRFTLMLVEQEPGLQHPRMSR